MSEQKIRTRFAPSPTGDLHVGNYRSALFSWLYAQSHQGEFIVRIEDTDKERSKEKYTKNILESLEWLGLAYDALYKQSENIESHKKHLQELIDKDLAYISKEEEGERDEVIRFRNPNKVVKFTDLVRGEIEFDTTELGDFVIAKSIDEPVFHLAVVVDDFEEEVTHVVRGEDHISNTPRHILIQEAIGAPTPIYAHLPLVMTAERKKLSKRHGAKPLLEYREDGFMPEGLINYMALLGWNPGTEQEIFSVKDLVSVFDLAKVHKGAAVFDENKLRWVNREHIKQTTDELNRTYMVNFLTKTKHAEKMSDDLIQKLTPVLLERIETYGDIIELIDGGEIDFLFEECSPEANEIVWGKLFEVTESESDAYRRTSKHLEHAKEKMEAITEQSFQSDKIKDALWDYATEQGRGEVLWPLRFSLTGKKQSPDPFSVASLLGQKETIERIAKAIEILSKEI